MGTTLHIVNPGASGGQGEIAWRRFLEGWPHAIHRDDIRITERPGHAQELAAEADGHDVLVAVGGDGCVNEVLNGIMAREGTRPALAIIPAGTGNDIARNIGVYPMDSSIDALRDGATRAFDVIRIDGDDDGRRFTRYGLLTGGVGFSAAVGIPPWTKRLFGPTVAYYLHMVRSIVTHRPPTMSVTWDDRQYDGRTWMVLTANVESTAGSSMRIAPGASPTDGLLWVTIVEAKPKLTMVLTGLPKVASGEHVDNEGFHYFSTRRIEIVCSASVVVDVDGEGERARSVTVSVVPGAVAIVAPP